MVREEVSGFSKAPDPCFQIPDPWPLFTFP